MASPTVPQLWYRFALWRGVLFINIKITANYNPASPGITFTVPIDLIEVNIYPETLRIKQRWSH
jgi:hypothetical protein